MDRETEAAPGKAQAANGLPPIFQRPTYPSGEPATKAPERAPEEPRERVPDERAPRSRAPAREKAPARQKTPAPDGPDEYAVDIADNDRAVVHAGHRRLTKRAACGSATACRSQESSR